MLTIIDQLLEKGKSAVFKLEDEILQIQTQDTYSQIIRIPILQIEYQQIAQKLAQIYKQLNQNSYKEIISIVNQMNLFNLENEINNKLISSYQEEEEDEEIGSDEEDNQSEEQEEQESSFQEEEEEEEREINMEIENNIQEITIEQLQQNKKNQEQEEDDDDYDEIHDILLLIQKDSIDIVKRNQKILEEKLYSTKKAQNRHFKKKEKKFEDLFEQEYYTRFLKNKNMNKHFQKILKQKSNKNQKLLKVNSYQDEFKNLNELIINMISKDSNFEIEINFSLIRNCLFEQELEIQNLQFVNIQRLYHTNQQKYRNVDHSNFYSDLIELLDEKNQVLKVENLDFFIEDQNIITHDQNQSIDHCMCCYNVVSNCGNYGFQQRIFNLKNIVAQSIQIELQQNDPVFHDIILHNKVKQITFTGEYGFGVNFIFKNGAYINQVNWNIKKFSLPFTIWVFEKFFIGKIGHLCFQNLTNQCYYDSLVNPSIFTSPISYSFNKYHREYDKYGNNQQIVKDLQVKLNERFIFQMQSIILYKLSDLYFNLSPFKIVQDLYF